MSAANGNGNAIGDSAASARHKALHKELGIDTYAEYPRELIEFRMDRPPKAPKPAASEAEWARYDEERSRWKPIHGPKVRIYAAYMRYSWCWPICLPYAVLTDERDEILRDRKGNPLVLTQEHVADMLGLSQQRVAQVTLDLIADKLVRVESRPAAYQGGARVQAVLLEPRPTLTKEERSDKSTLRQTGIEGPRLEPAVLRRMTSLFKQLGEDDALITVPAEGSEQATETIAVSVYRTRLWRRVLAARTVFIGDLKTLRYSERKAYSDVVTEARNLISQSQSSDSLPASKQSLQGTSSSRPAAAGAAGRQADKEGGQPDTGNAAGLDALRELFPGEAIRPESIAAVDRLLSEALGVGYSRQAYVEAVRKRKAAGRIRPGLALSLDPKNGLAGEFIREAKEQAVLDEDWARRAAAADEAAEQRAIWQLVETWGSMSAAERVDYREAFPERVEAAESELTRVEAIERDVEAMIAAMRPEEWETLVRESLADLRQQERGKRLPSEMQRAEAEQAARRKLKVMAAGAAGD